MTKSDLHILFISFVILLTQACTSDDNISPAIPAGMVEVNPSIINSQTQLRTNVDGDAFVDGDSFVLYEGNPGLTAQSVTYTYNNFADEWTANPILYWDNLSVWTSGLISNPTNISFTAVLTNGGTLSSSGSPFSFTIAADQNVSEKDFLKNDLLVAYDTKNAYNKSGRKLELNFKHVFARLDIEIKETIVAGDNIPILGADTELKIDLAKTGNEIIFQSSSPAGTTVTTSGTAEEVTMFPLSKETLSNTITHTYSIILPAQPSTGTKLLINGHNNNKNYEFDLDGLIVSGGDDTGNLLQQGRKADLKLTIEKTGVVFGSVLLTDWTGTTASQSIYPSDYPEILISGDDEDPLTPPSSDNDYAGKTIKLTECITLAKLKTLISIPLGTRTVPFRGTFDGQGHTILDVDLETLDQSDPFLGIFGYTDGATIKNLNATGTGITNANESANSATGGLVGYAYNTRIENCHVIYTGTDGVNAIFDNAGGLVGYANGRTTIHGCSANTSVNTGHDYAGGLIGRFESGVIITESFARGDVKIIPISSGGNYAGGLAGYATGGIVENCYAWGRVQATRYAGGLIGRTALTEIKNSYAGGREVVGGTGQGGLIGYSGSHPKNCYWNVNMVPGKLGVTGNTLDNTNAGFTLVVQEAAMAQTLTGLNRDQETTPKWEIGKEIIKVIEGGITNDGFYALPLLINNNGAKACNCPPHVHP